MPRCRFFLSVFPALLSLFAANAQTNKGFVATGGITLGGSPLASATADLNHDGIPDVVVADGTSPSTQAVEGVVVLLGKEDGTLGPPVHYATSDSASFICLADVNGDGNPDIITASFDPTILKPGGSMQVLQGKGDGTFGEAAKYTVPGELIQRVYAGDFNGNGHIDLAVSTITLGANVTQGLAIFLNNGNGTFHLGQQTTNVSPFGVADFNRDGIPDLVVGHYSVAGALESIGVLFGAGNGTFTRSGPVYPITFSNLAIADLTIQDFNEDGYPDVALVLFKSNTLHVLLTNPDGSFTVAPHPPETDGGASIISGDFNHDGHMDVAIVTSEEQNDIDILLGHGDGTFAYRTSYGTDLAWGFGPGGISTADLNHDSYLDLISVNNTGTLSVLYGKPGGTFNAEMATGPGWMGANSTVAGDFNGDGLPDVAVLYSNSQFRGNSTVSIYQGTGNGHFRPPGAHYVTDTTGSAFAAGDVNGDGKLDLVVAGSSSYGTPPYSVLLGNGNGTFQSARLLGSQVCPPRGTQIFLVDINNDGKLDFVNGNGVSFGNGDGTFGACVPFFPSVQDYFNENNFALGDFNNDGKLDLAFISMSGDVVEIHLGDGTGKFNPEPSSFVVLPYQAIGPSTFIAVGHFTKNGALGVAVGDNSVSERIAPGEFQGENHGAMSVLGGNGDGTLSPPVTYQLPQFLLGLAVADFNGDGLDDVAALNFNHYLDSVPTFVGEHSYLSLFISAGDGTLNPEIDFGAGEIGLISPFSTQIMSVADFNRDGAPDIAGMANAGLGVLLNSRGVGVSLAASPMTTKVGQAVTLKATVSAGFAFSGSIAEDAQVTFYAGSTVLGSADLVSGVASLTTTNLSIGSHTLSAIYSGNAGHDSRRSNSVKEVVSQ